MAQPQFVSPGQAVSRRVVFEGRISRIVDYFGGAAPVGGGPQAYLVEQHDYVLRPHFHPVDQFQVLLGATGSLFGRRPIGALEVHYADAFTVYGPLAGGSPPLRYFTLRAEPTLTTSFMPESRALLPPHAGRSLHAGIDLARTDDGEALLADDRDGLRVGRRSAGPGAELSVPAAGPGGQFLYVAAGAVSVAGVEGDHGPESIGWQAPGDGPAILTAGAEGAELLVLRYPEPSERRSR
ncbi:hypothetical protein OG455_05795 [Kitasatospora sp. NBC_01287]|uniref:hypothetical protein n=1 Tax=Kitasatospora sp. NBC_01287 TaxID=2903573 RepID=UPI00224DA495|nr:hypothetical protein [Kitasatospora sp. NBC_01287]MCX4745041.1 hypothetical protein [Kitasatospora sp. NBC_01287]